MERRIPHPPDAGPQPRPAHQKPQALPVFGILTQSSTQFHIRMPQPRSRPCKQIVYFLLFTTNIPKFSGMASVMLLVSLSLCLFLLVFQSSRGKRISGKRSKWGSSLCLKCFFTFRSWIGLSRATGSQRCRTRIVKVAFELSHPAHSTRSTMRFFRLRSTIALQPVSGAGRCPSAFCASNPIQGL